MTKISKISYSIMTPDVDKKIALITDLHYYSAKDIKKLNQVLEALSQNTVDYICISGDFIDVGMVKDMDIFIDWLKRLASLKKVIMSMGGHDIVRDKKDKQYYYNEELYSKIKSIDNLYLLDNDIYVDDNIRFIGLTLPLDFYYKYKENLNYFKRFVNNTFDTYVDKYNILLCHTPVPLTRLTSYRDIKLLNNIQLVLSGHTHAGIVPLCLRSTFKGRGIFSPSDKRKLFPKNSYGLIKRGKTHIVISSGITKASHSNPVPFVDGLFDSEITYINLKRNPSS